MSSIITTDSNAVFWVSGYFPKKIINEYIKRWKNTKVDSFEDYYKAIRLDEDRLWWVDLDHIDRSYNDYVSGSIQSRYPRGLKVYPHYVFEALMHEIALKVKFDG